MTQRRLGEQTDDLQLTAPKLWAYLTGHSPRFERRKSSICDRQPRFSMFGIGGYSFAAYKVAVSGLHKIPRFHAIGPFEGRAVLLDDTSYLVACSSAAQSAFLAALLNDPASLGLMRSMIFPDSKRPVTKKALQRIDLGALIASIDRHELFVRADSQ